MYNSKYLILKHLKLMIGVIFEIQEIVERRERECKNIDSNSYKLSD